MTAPIAKGSSKRNQIYINIAPIAIKIEKIPALISSLLTVGPTYSSLL